MMGAENKVRQYQLFPEKVSRFTIFEDRVCVRQKMENEQIDKCNL